MIKRRLKRIAYILLGIAIAALIWANRTGRLEPAAYTDKGTLIPVKSGEPLSPGAIPVSLGVYVEKVYAFSAQAQTYSAEGWVWLNWPQKFQDLLDAGKIAPGDILTVVNGIQDLDYSFKPVTPSPIRLPDGGYHQLYALSVDFSAIGLDFRRFPFETIHFPMTFGLNPDLHSLNAGVVRLLPDMNQSALGEYCEVPGYFLAGKRFKEFLYQFQSNLGLPADHPEAAQFSRVQMEVVYKTSVLSAVLQLFLPLAVVMSVVLLAPNLAGSLYDVRIALPSTALLTLIFLQQGYRAQLPELPYLTFVDQIYALCYAAALVIFCQFVWSSNKLDGATDENRASVVAHINKIDLRVQVILASGLIVLSVLAWFFPVK